MGMDGGKAVLRRLTATLVCFFLATGAAAFTGET